MDTQAMITERITKISPIIYANKQVTNTEAKHIKLRRTLARKLEIKTM